MLLFGFPAAPHALRLLERCATTQNPIDAVELVDDKAATAIRLTGAGVAQVQTEIVAFEFDEIAAAAHRFGYPVVIKRTHGAQGRWVRHASDDDELASAAAELAEEGPGAIVVQPEIIECRGRGIRAVLTGGSVLVVTERIAGAGEWRSNIARGGRQQPVELTDAEHRLVVEAVRAEGLAHAGVDLLRTASGPKILEINSCPDFTSMQPYTEVDLARAVVLASLPA
jgi:ribosomal protein S6--L-glutamate ligase